jgi:hypothetical protein
MPAEPPALDDRPPWHEPIEALGDQGGARAWNREAVLEACDGFIPWLTSPEGPADRRFSDATLRQWLSLKPGRPDIRTVRRYLGTVEQATAALLDRHLAR